MKKIIFVSLLALVFTGCKKDSLSGSSEKEIYSFVLPLPSPHPYIAGNVGTDTISVRVPAGVSLVSMIPDIEFAGTSISPAQGTPADFTHPVIYTVTAEDGSTRNYVVIVSYISTTKQILDLRFKPSANPALLLRKLSENL